MRILQLGNELLLNNTYKIDFKNWKQIRRDCCTKTRCVRRVPVIPSAIPVCLLPPKYSFSLESIGDGHNTAEYFEVLDRVDRFQKTEHMKKLVVLTIEKIHNPTLQERYKSRKSQLLNPHGLTVWKFHGSSSDNISKIMDTGFKVGTSGGMYGTGIYFATDSTKSEKYSSKYKSNQLLLCKLALGKVWTLNSAALNLNPSQVLPNYDSVFAPRQTHNTGGVMHDEYVLYHPDQVIPMYLITYLGI